MGTTSSVNRTTNKKKIQLFLPKFNGHVASSHSSQSHDTEASVCSWFSQEKPHKSAGIWLLCFKPLPHHDIQQKTRSHRNHSPAGQGSRGISCHHHPRGSTLSNGPRVTAIVCTP